MRLNRKAGFTLVELMVAAGIVAVVSMSLLAGYSACFTLAEMSRNIIVATEDAQRVASQMRSIAVTAWASVVTTNWTTWAAANGCNSLPTEQVLVVFVDRDADGDALTDDPLQANINVTWQEKGRARTFTVTELITLR